MALITYDDKVFLNENPNIPDVNKIKDTDLNQIKTGVNTNESNIGALETSFTDLTTYSTTEKVIGTYNGKPLYRKMYDFTQINIGTETKQYDRQLDLTDIDYCFLDEIHSYYINTDSGQRFPITYVNPGATTPVYTGYFVSKENNIPTFHFRKSQEIKVWSIYITLEYTKTTD